MCFNPPPGWPTPPATWLPPDEWLPDPEWPEPPSDWTFWSVTASQPRAGSRRAGRGHLGRVSFPVATVAAQSTVSLAALFPERGRQTAASAYGSSTGATAAPATKAGREYYEPRGWGGSSTVGAGASAAGSVLNGSAPTAPGHLLVQTDPVIADADTVRGPDDVAEDAEEAGEAEEAEMTPGIRLSPILRLVAHPSGLRVQFRVGGPVAAALAEVMTPAIEAATPGLIPTGGASSGRAASGGPDRGGSGRRQGRQGRLRLLRRGRHEASDLPADTSAGRRVGDRPVALSVRELAGRALTARRESDREEALAVDRDLCSFHRQPFSAIRPPVVTPLEPLTASEVAAVRQQVLAAAGATAKGLSRSASTELKAHATEQAAAFVSASNVARRVLADRRAALASGAWQLLESHDPAAVVAVVDEALRLSGSDVTCLDAGTDPVTERAYVTVLVRFATIGIVAEEGREAAPSGRTSWRARTAWERNGVYAAGLAAVVLAAAKHVDSIAPATDDVNVVVVRPTRNGRGVEPVYVGRLDREDVSLRHPEADPLPLVIGSAVPHGIRIHGPEREVTALEHAVDVDGALREIVDACRAADARAARLREAAGARPGGSVPPAG
ncbi:hypothetical protein [Terracoccus sp. 273MFTsu3.1]|uniref:hypothetical protein n=1 Tax=Terracoccus sp. 273MFTsu3.1 TaxID=1172188 RepID=UPI0012DC3244|nr:hypothetical protein [Terracoccus sp. 273MFTsu3.1]